MPKIPNNVAVSHDSSSPGVSIVVYNSMASPSPPPSSSPPSVDHSPAAETPTVSSKRYAPYVRDNKDKKNKQGSIVPMANLVADFRIDFKAYPETSVAKRFQFINNFFQQYSSLCVYHLLISSAETMTPHSSITDCDLDFGLNSFYRDEFRRAIVIQNYACFHCACPLGSPFNHGPDVGNRCPETQLAEFIKPIPFIVINSPEIRPLVFKFLGVKPDYFLANQTEFAAWLGFKSGSTKLDSNLMNVVYAVAYLLEDKKFPTYTSFELPGKPLFVFRFIFANGFV
jgi:hypothetical protein